MILEPPYVSEKQPKRQPFRFACAAAENGFAAALSEKRIAGRSFF